MKITDSELNIKTILDVQKGNIPPSNQSCRSRRSDCFVYVLSGQATYIFGSREQTAAAGNIIFLSKGSDYFIKVSDENYSFIFIDFLFENQSGEALENNIYKSISLSVTENSFEKIYSLWLLGDFSDKIYCKSLILKIYSSVAKSSLSQYVSTDRRLQIEEAAKYIADNIGNSNLKIEHLSERCKISDVHFRRLFAHVYHTSPIKFITTARIRRAKELLTTSDMSILSISDSCGFVNHYYFSKIFKSETNMTPTEFRRYFKTNH